MQTLQIHNHTSRRKSFSAYSVNDTHWDKSRNKPHFSFLLVIKFERVQSLPSSTIKKEMSKKSVNVYWIENPLSEIPDILPGDIVVEGKVLGDVSLALSDPKYLEAVWFEFFPNEFPYAVIPRYVLNEFVKQAPKGEGIPLEEYFNVFLPVEELAKVVQDSKHSLWKINVGLQGPTKGYVTLSPKRESFFDKNLWFVNVAHCKSGSCLREDILIQHDPTRIIRWKGNREILGLAVALAQKWIELKDKKIACDWRKKVGTAFGRCYMNEIRQPDYLPKITTDLPQEKALELLKNSRLCNDFIVMVWQLALLSRNQKLSLMPVNASACTAIDLLQLPVYAKEVWKSHPLPFRQKAPLEKKKKPESITQLANFVA